MFNNVVRVLAVIGFCTLINQPQSQSRAKRRRVRPKEDIIGNWAAKHDLLFVGGGLVIAVLAMVAGVGVYQGWLIRLLILGHL